MKITSLLPVIIASLLGGTTSGPIVVDDRRRLVPPRPFGPADPHAGWWLCSCGARLNPMDKRWRDLRPVAKLLATGWVERMGQMVCEKCRYQP